MKTERSLTFTLILTAAGALALSSCYTTSISNPGNGRSHRGGGGNGLYGGELHAFDVLGTPDGGEVTEAQIQAALGRGRSGVRIPKSADVLLVQSGATLPDHALQTAMARHFDIQPFSGIPVKAKSPNDKPADVAKRLRLAAAQAGAEYVICVWGTLETAEGELPGEAVSWIPVGGQFVPDKQKATRINLKAIIVDVSSGNWTSVSSEPVIRKHVSAPLNRTAAWDRQIETLKASGYPMLADAVARAS